MGLSDVGILAAHPLVDDYEFFNGTSYAIGTTSDTLIVDGVYIYPPTTSLGGFSVLEHCVISAADSTGTKFKRILSASTTDLECSKIEIFEFGIRIIGTVSCVGFGSCQSNGVSFSMEWNNTIYSSNSCSGCFFIIDMTLDGNVSRISTVSVQGLSTSTNCRMPTIKDAVVSGDNSTYLLTSHSKNGYTTSSNHPCLWSPNRNTAAWSAVTDSRILWKHNSSGVSSWWIKTGYAADDGAGVKGTSYLFAANNTDDVYLIGESGVNSNADCGRSPPSNCKLHYSSASGWIVTKPYNAYLGKPLPYVSKFSGLGTHLDTNVVEIDDNGQYYREEYSRIEAVNYIGMNQIYLRFSYSADSRSDTDTAQIFGHNLTEGTGNGFIIEMNNTTISSAYFSNLASGIMLSIFQTTDPS